MEIEVKLTASNGGVCGWTGRFPPSEKTTTKSRLHPWADLFSGSAQRSLMSSHVSAPLIVLLHGVAPSRLM
ncbi:unnamed protein product [Arabidopsis thaliana]|uniref:(thale cress) hypothetical protein n=1 Tax=Arabidopsis thaliana TaxID=3702 RepID=A0A178UYD9_ARATH|nr:hypothetical protein AXX17_AT4G09960 [Arabidopsis thaliana]CAD5327349.1 unnamed protein product [Arabidopsis thaliana]